MLTAGKPVLITDGLSERLPGLDLDNDSLLVLKVGGNPRGLLSLTREQLRVIRDKMLAPFGMKFDGPNKVALYLIGDDCSIIENFNDEAVDVSVQFSKAVNPRKALVLPGDGNVELAADGGKVDLRKMTPRTLVALHY